MWRRISEDCYMMFKHEERTALFAIIDMCYAFLVIAVKP